MLAGKYRVERVLGAGGMGMVVAARHLDLNKLVALKFMLSSAAQNPEAAHRFVQEARAAAQLRSEHVAHVSDYGTLHSGEPYIVIEYLEGEDLAAVLERGGPLNMGFAVELLLQACEAMDEAHSKGIIHRDIKPQNLFLTTRRKGTPCLKVLDFGLSKVALTGEAPAGLHQTNTAALLGSPLYMSPEQMRSARGVDYRADIWSLGATLYELVCGQPPFPSESLMELCVKLSSERPRAPRELRPELPPGLEWAILHCLEADPQARFQSVAELSAALAPFASHAPRETGASGPAPLHTAGAISHERFAATGNGSPSTDNAQLPSTSASSSWGTTHSTGARQPRSLWPVGLGLAVLVLGGAGWLLQSRAHGQAAAASASASSQSAPVTALRPVAEEASAPSHAAAPEVPSAPAASASASPAPPPAPVTQAAAPKAPTPKPRTVAAARPPVAPAAAPPKPQTVQEDPWSRK